MKTSPNPNPRPKPVPGPAPRFRRTPLAFALAIAVAALLAPPLAPTVRATLLTATGISNRGLGLSGSASGAGALLTGYFLDEGTTSSAVYYYQGLDAEDPQQGPVTETMKLLPSNNGEGTKEFGWSSSIISVSLLEDNALVGANNVEGKETNSGAAYYYKALDEKNPADGPVTETMKLIASDGVAGKQFGLSASLSSNPSGDNALVGDPFAIGNENRTGAAYYYKGLDSMEGNHTGIAGFDGQNITTETMKLIATDGVENDYLGQSVSLSGDNALVGATGATGKESQSGAAYYYQALDTVNPQDGPVKETVKLIASDGAASDWFGQSVSLSGANALVGAIGAYGEGASRAAAYYYQGLDTVNPQDGPVKETVKLLPSDGAPSDYFGRSVSLSGANALVMGNTFDYDNRTNTDTAYYYQALDAVNDNLTDLDALEGKKATYETVKLFTTESTTLGYYTFNSPGSLDGNRFLMGSVSSDGKAYANDIRAFTTLDAGTATGTTLATSGLSFISRTDWIIGKETANNTIILTAGDTADVTHADKAIYIGQTAGADNNTLHIEGTLTATTIYVGAGGSDSTNTGNTLRLTTAALDTLAIGTLYLDAGNFLEFEDAAHAIDHEDVLTLLDGTIIQVRGSSSEGWDPLTTDNAATLLVKTYTEDGAGGIWTRFTPFSVPAVPEPATWAALAGQALLTFAATQRRRPLRPRRGE
ncbi:MAG: FG-GAP repeat protein [Opitutaceae bacterium]|jgi:hypothetical protein|nr:FG-GAP repeat protein [Opitutaceae bacterium]